jgi:phage tail-like protein
MPEDGSAQSAATWPLTKFQFLVKWDATILYVQEVSGLSSDPPAAKLRAGSAFSTIKMPGMQKSGNVTLKKVTPKGDDKLWEWMNQTKMNVIKRVPLTIQLLDETNNPVMTWTLSNAWPTKMSGSDQSSGTIETIEFAHEGLTMAG